jgi:hypothetical protein
MSFSCHQVFPDYTTILQTNAVNNCSGLPFLPVSPTSFLIVALFRRTLPVPSAKCPLQNLYNMLGLLVIHNNEPFSLGRSPLYVKAKLFGK